MPQTATKNTLPVFELIVVAVCLLFLEACAASKEMSSKLLINKESYCDPPINMMGANRVISHNIDSVLAGNHLLTEKFSVPSIILMHALGILDEGTQLVQLKDDTGYNMHRFQLKQRIQSKVLLAGSEIDAIAAELDCEGQRIEQIAQYMETLNAKHTTRLTVASVVIGAATGIASALVSNSDWVKGIAIGGGVMGAGLSLATLNPRGKKIQLSHKRNLLRNVWLQENNNELPSFVWFMLTEKRISNAGTSSLLANLKHRWVRYQFDGKEAEGNASVNFTEGGIYHVDDLHDRSAMISQLRVEVRSLEQYLNIFLWELQ
jgi:hypothetical protein